MTQMRERTTPHTSPTTIAPGQASTYAMPEQPAAIHTKGLPRYSLLRWRTSRAQKAVGRVALVVALGLAYLYYVWYQRSGDVSPDSIYGYGFAIVGTLLLLIVGIGYIMRKRRRRQWIRRLHTVLAWHVWGGLLGLLLIVMHAAGNFNPRSGTYALYGLIALIVSGIIGRVLDRVAPLLAARAALRVLTTSGEERLDDLERQLRAKRGPERHRRAESSPPRASGVPWDIGYYDLDPEIETIPTLVGLGADRAPAAHAASHRSLSLREVKREVRAIESAMGSEEFFIQLVRVWRHLHILISLAFLGLLIWHLVYAAQLLMNTW